MGDATIIAKQNEEECSAAQKAADVTRNRNEEAKSSPSNEAEGPESSESRKEQIVCKRKDTESKLEARQSKLTNDVFYLEVIDHDKKESEPGTPTESSATPTPTPRRVNKLRDHNSTIFPVGCMGCREDPPSDHIASPRRFLDPFEAKDHIGHIDNTPKKRPVSAKPNNISRNPLTGVGVDDDEVKKPFGRRRADGNPLLGEGYETKSVTPSCTRIPPGGYSQGLW
ncbi:hypothetical protein Trydic_g6347 [Trypoxylus dichotomus]